MKFNINKTEKRYLGPEIQEIIFVQHFKVLLVILKREIWKIFIGSGKK